MIFSDLSDKKESQRWKEKGINPIFICIFAISKSNRELFIK